MTHAQDNYSGILPRWHVTFNFTMLRLISFGCDYHWAMRGYGAIEDARAQSEAVQDARVRVRGHRDRAELTLGNYLLYIFYPPLFIAGPILTFNDFTAQLQRPLLIPGKTVAKYALRVGADILVMELMMHYMYVNAIKNTRAWEGDSPMELSMVGFWNLIFVWLKVRLHASQHYLHSAPDPMARVPPVGAARRR